MGSFATLPDGLGSAYVALPSGGPGPGVLVLHAWWGLNPTFTAACDRLASAGFVAVAPDLFGDRVVTTTPAETEARSDAAPVAPMHARAAAALALLDSHPVRLAGPIGVVGFSFGAYFALSLSQSHPEIGAVVTFYGTAGGDFSGASADYLGHYVPGDEWEPDEVVKALESKLAGARRGVTFHSYPGTSHWFFEPDRPEFDAGAAALAWDRTIAFLEAHLQPAAAEGRG